MEAELKHGEYEEGDLGPADPDPWEVCPEDISGEYVRLPAQLARAMGVYADAASAVLRLEREAERTWAEIYLAAKRALQGVAPKATEAIVEATVQTTKAYCAACDRLVEAQAAKLRANADVESLKAKKDMLVSLGAHIRAELEGLPPMRERAVGERGRKV